MHYSDINRLNVRSIRKLARETFGKELPETATKAEAVTLVLEMFASEGDPVIGNPDDVAASQRELTSPDRRMRVIIHSSENFEDDVFLAVNGRSISIKRDQEVDIPLPHYEALKNCTQGTLERMDGDRPVIKQMRRFNFSVLGEVDSTTGELTR